MKRLFYGVCLALTTSLSLGLSVQAASATETTATTVTVSDEQNIVLAGDSYASGLGAGSYKPEAGACAQSLNSYGELTARALRRAHPEQVTNVANLTCAGATVQTVRDTQLAAVNADTDLVMISIGGNDLGFVQIGQQCINGDCSTISPVDIANKLLVVRDRVKQLLVDIAARAPHASVVLVGYGQLVSPNPTTPPGSDPICGLFSPQERLFAFGLELGLDATLRNAVNSSGLGARAVYYSPYLRVLPPTLRAPFAGRSLCGTVQPALYHGLDDPTAVLHGTSQWHQLVSNDLVFHFTH